MRVPGDTDLHPGARVTMSDQMIRCPDSRVARPPTPGSAGAAAAVDVRHRPALGAGQRPGAGGCLALGEPAARRGRRTSTALLDGVDLVVVRLLGGRQAWEAGLDALLAPSQPRPVVVLGGEQSPDAQLMESSTVPVGVADPGAPLPRPGRVGEPHAAAPLPLRHRPAHRPRLRPAGRDAELGPARGLGAERRALRALEPADGARARHPPPPRRDRLLPRAPHGREHRVRRRPVPRAWSTPAGCPSRCSARRCAAPRTSSSRCSGRPTSWSRPCSRPAGRGPAAASAGQDDESWDTGALAALDVPILQALCLTRSAARTGSATTTA